MWSRQVKYILYILDSSNRIVQERICLSAKSDRTGLFRGNFFHFVGQSSLILKLKINQDTLLLRVVPPQGQGGYYYYYPSAAVTVTRSYSLYERKQILTTERYIQ